MRLGFACSILLLFSLAVPCNAQTNAADVGGNADVSKEAWIIERSLTTISVEDSGRDVREVTAEVKLLSDAGVKQFAVLNFRYTSANENVEVDYVRVRKQDGTVVKTPDYNIQDMPADITRTAPLYSDIHEKHVAVKGLGVGDVLEYRVRYRTHTPQVPGHFWFEYNITTDQIVRDERLEVSVPNDKHINVKSAAYKPEVVEQGSTRIYKWKHSNLQRKDEEETTPKRSTPPPDIQISTFTNWEEIGRWYSELQKDQVAVTPAISKKAEELAKGLTTEDDKLRSIYSFVALHIHYIGLDFGIGRYKPHAAEEVLDNEYGDCKDKHTLLAALLNAAGFDAWPVLIHASQKLDVDVPSPAQFNHVITVVPRGKELVWLDTTTEVAPFGLLLSPLRDKQALVIPTGKPALLQTTPANPPFPQEQSFTAVAKLGADGVLNGHIVRRFRGDHEVVLRAALRQIPEAKWKDGVQNLSRAAGFRGEVSNVVISPIEDLQKPLEISYDYLRKNYSDWEHKQILALVPPMGIEAESLKEKAPKEPVFLGAAGEIVYTSEIELPPGSSLTPPKNVDLVESYAEYHTQNLLESGKLKTSRRLVIKKPEVALAEWDSYKKMAKAASEEAFNYLPLSGLGEDKNAASQEASNFLVVPGLGDLDAKEGRGRPDVKSEASTKAKALARQGYEALHNKDYSLAIELLKKAVELDPNSDYGWHELGLAYYKSNQNSLAIGAFKKAIEINPNHHYAYNNLGLVYLRTQEYELAINVFKKQFEINPRDEYAYNNLGLVYLRQRRYEDAVNYFKKQIEISPLDRYAHGNLARAYLELKKYDASVPEFEEALKLSPDNVSLRLSLGNAYVKSGNKEKASAHLRAAVETVERSSPLDYMQLNNVAYSLAEDELELDLAKRSIEKALEELDRRSSATTNEGQSRLTLTRAYSFLWDTAGWVYFKLGDLPRAESYVRASWLLDQKAVVGEHLGEIYEKLGKNDAAVHAYELAYVAKISSVAGAVGVTGESQDAQEQARVHYQKLTGKPLNIDSIDSAANGNPPISAELSELREAKLGPEPGPNDSADFELKFAAGEPIVATYLSGNTEMKSMKKRLEAAKFKVEIPVGSKATLYRRATVHCSKWSPCSAVLAPLDSFAMVPNVR